MIGYLSLGYMWARMAAAASKRLRDFDGDETFMKNKLQTARSISILGGLHHHYARVWIFGTQPPISGVQAAGDGQIS